MTIKKLVQTIHATLFRRQRSKRVARSIARLFDADWYLAQYPDVAAAGVNPLRHYVMHGAQEGRDPSPLFHSKWYLEQYPDVAAAGVNPLWHYVMHGAQEGRDPSPLFHSKWYLEQYPDVAAAGVNPLQHFMENGRSWGRRSHKYTQIRVLVEQNKLATAAHLFATMGPSFSDPCKAIVCPLRDVYSYAKENGKILVTSTEVEFLLEVANTNASKRYLSKSRSSPYLAELCDIAMLPGSSLMINHSGCALDDELDFAVRQFHLEPKRSDFLMSPDKQLLLRFKDSALPILDRGIHLCKEHDTNYFHWVVEILPRLFMVEQFVRDKTIPLFVSDGLDQNLYDLLHFVACRERPILRLDQSRLCRVRNLLYPSDVSRILDVYAGESGFDTAYLAVELIKPVMQRVKNECHISDGLQRRRRLYLRRRSSYRRLLNERDIEEHLVGMGFELLDPSGLSIVSQIQLFSQAEIVVGATGAALTNIIWCRHSTPVVVLYSGHPVVNLTIWAQLAEVSGATVSYISGQRCFNRTDLYSIHDDFTVDASIVTKHVRGLLI